MHPFVILQHLLPQHLLSRLIGKLAAAEIGWLKNIAINAFIRRYKVNMQEAESGEVEAYKSFNHFFTRALKPGIRQFSGNISSPCDGRVSQLGDISGGQLIQAKGISYSLEQLLATDRVGDYQNGSFITIYLAPKDYHRVHTPADCQITRSRYIPGRLFSVNLLTTSQIPGLFTKNERLICDLHTENSQIALVMVGAMIVAGINPVWLPSAYSPGHFQEQTRFDNSQFEQGSELGRFELGSTVILLLENRVTWEVSPGEVVKLGQKLVA